MKYDEFAFFNQQLAAMLRDGIPLEGALQRLCQEMRRGTLRDELQALEADLAKGMPISDALVSRRLPELYKNMVLVGVKSGDLPGALTMVGDYFQNQNNLWMRLKSLMVYPLIVLSAAFFISCFLSFILGAFIWNNLQSLVGDQLIPTVSVALWMSPLFIGLALTAIIVGASVSTARRKLRWTLPAFKEASLARVASAVSLMLKNGVPLDDAFILIAQMEKGTPAEKVILSWRQRLAAGHGKFSELAEVGPKAAGTIFPPLFIWTVAQAGEDLKEGFRRVAELYQARSKYRTELLLYSALPCAVIILAIMIISQISPVFAVLISFIQALSGNEY